MWAEVLRPHNAKSTRPGHRIGAIFLSGAAGVRIDGGGSFGMHDFHYWLRYYSPAIEKPVHEAISTLLPDIGNKHGIESDTIALRLVPSLLSSTILVPDEDHEKEIYERDFLPRWPLLNARTETRIGKVLRTRSHRYCVAGTVAVLSNEGIEWYCVFGDQFSKYDQDHRLGFLKAVLANGPSLLVDLCSDRGPRSLGMGIS